MVTVTVNNYQPATSKL